MRKHLITYIFLLICISAIGQINEFCNSSLKGHVVNQEVFSNFELSSYYFPIHRNEDYSPNFKSNLSKNQQYIQMATGIPSYFFKIKYDGRVLISITVSQKYIQSENTFSYNICNLENGETKEIISNFSGDITEDRARELIELEIDNNARINSIAHVGSEIYFDGRSFKILEFEKLKNDIIKLVEIGYLFKKD